MNTLFRSRSYQSMSPEDRFESDCDRADHERDCELRETEADTLAGLRLDIDRLDCESVALRRTDLNQSTPKTVNRLIEIANVRSELQKEIAALTVGKLRMA